MAAERAPAFDAWLDAFFASYFQRRPVNATFIGMHAFDDRLPDFSEQGNAATLGDAEDLMQRLDDLPVESLTAPQAIDRQLAEGFLRIQRWESGSAHCSPTAGNPTLFTGEAIFGVVSLLLRPFAPLEQRLEMATARLSAVPAFLQDGMRPVGVPMEWIARARRECTGAQLLLGDGIDALVAEAGVDHPRLRQAASAAADSFGEYDCYLERELVPRATNAYACGEEALDLLLRHGHVLPFGADELERQALERVQVEDEALLAAPPPPVDGLRAEVSSPEAARGAEAPAPADPAEPAARAYLARFDRMWKAARDLAIEGDLLSFPDWPVCYVERPAWARQAAPYLYFLPYRSPPPFDEMPVVDYLVPPGSDDSTIKLNHVVHHGSLGHHVQNWFAARAASRIGRIAAVDCASRIAMLCGGTMAEGWANYATDLADEAGFLTPAERYGQHRARLRMAARAIVDIRVHQGRFALGDAVRFYTERVGMTPEAAHAEAIKNSLFPGAACMYFVGWDGLWKLRRSLEVRQNASFALHAFHDRVLSFGSVPVSLIAQAMLAPTPVYSEL